MDNRPKGREKHITGKGEVKRRGDGLNTGPAGSGRPPSGGPPSGGGGGTRAGGKLPVPLLIVLLIALLTGGGGAFQLLGGGSDEGDGGSGGTPTVNAVNPAYLFGGGSGSMGSTANNAGWSLKSNCGQLNKNVDDNARKKHTVIKGNGDDRATVLIYMCGTDLESRSGMATSDLQEMAAAELSDNVNVIVYTGGCSNWKNGAVSKDVNQIYQVKEGGLKCLVENAGRSSMTNPDNLAAFISWGKENFPANRMELILWDHGGGTLSGYGYDEKNRGTGSMTLEGISAALKKADVKFDFIGFDACLMATVETGLMLDDYADYMIASEETEPGVGWYYTDWLTEFSENPSIITVELGKMICDNFVRVCSEKCRGQQTTLSVVDLAELAATVPPALDAFGKDVTRLVVDTEQYKTVSNARYGTREFAKSSRIDQVDLVHLATNVDTKAGNDLAAALLHAVKYNQTSANMANAYGLAIYFPYRNLRNVDKAVHTYQSIGLDGEYCRCIQDFASMQVGGQAAGGGSGTASPLTSLLGGMMSSGTSGGSNPLGALAGMAAGTTSGSDAISSLLGGMLSGEAGISGLTGGSNGFFTGRSLDTEAMADYLSDHQLDPSALVWEEADGQKVMNLSEEQWGLIHDLALSAYYDDGSGYVDLGLDNTFRFTEDGKLIGETEGTWLAVNGQTVPYYYDDTVDDGEHCTISGHIPAMLNGERVNLKVVFDDENPSGCITGAVRVYTDGETDTIAKSMIELQEGDTLDFICDYYSYKGVYKNSYFLGDQMTVSSEMTIIDVELEPDRIKSMYRFTDLYEQVYWSEAF